MLNDDLNHRSKVESVFSKIPNYYDKMNDAMSMGMHRVWKRILVSKIPRIPYGSYADISSGTGDISILLAKKLHGFKIDLTCIDPDQGMLDIAYKKILNNGINPDLINFKCLSVEDLDIQDQFDCVTLAFGLRNFTDRLLGLKNIARSIKSGGKMICMEFSPSANKDIVNTVYSGYLNFIPKIGKIVSGDDESYSYLSDSIRNFPNKNEIKSMIIESGFSNVEILELSFGICNIYIAKR